jgi:DUF1365 family protein
MTLLKSTSDELNSALYTGRVHHCRYTPHRHAFDYPLYMFSLDLDEIARIQASVRAFSSGFFSPLRFRRADYLGDPQQDLKQTVLLKAEELGADNSRIDKVMLLGQVRCFGLYFSPVNFYFLLHQGEAVYMLAEVHNTPWNETHCYLVNVVSPQSQPKQFHVSPFMGMDMHYEWKIKLLDNRISIHIENWKTEKLFDATLALVRLPLDNSSVKTVLRHWPVMTLSIVRGIYWQALRLFIKKIPYHSHP